VCGAMKLFLVSGGTYFEVETGGSINRGLVSIVYPTGRKSICYASDLLTTEAAARERAKQQAYEHARLIAGHKTDPPSPPAMEEIREQMRQDEIATERKLEAIREMLKEAEEGHGEIRHRPNGTAGGVFPG
jgi:predicted Zn-dependent protease